MAKKKTKRTASRRPARAVNLAAWNTAAAVGTLTFLVFGSGVAWLLSNNSALVGLTESAKALGDSSARIERRLDAMDRRLDKMDDRMVGLGERLGDIDGRLKAVEVRLESTR